jgi:DNA polymerase III subunit delta
VAAKAVSKEKSDTVTDAFEFLGRNEKAELPVVVVCVGPDDFLRRRASLKAVELGGMDASLLRTFDGDESEWRDVHAELSTRSLFDADGNKGARLRNGDKFVSRHRDALENWLERATSGATLFLEVQTMPANTKVYKLAKQRGWIVNCLEAKDGELQSWVMHWGKTHHGLKLSKHQAEIMVQRIGPVCGLIDCELAKLALFASPQGNVSDERVLELVGGWRTQTVWSLADAVADGRIQLALEAIDKLFMAGQSAFGVAAQLSWSLRRFGVAAHQVEQMERLGQRPVLFQALERAGFKPFEIKKAEASLRRIGRPRAKELLSWLVQLELQLKGSHGSEDRARLALESFLFQFCDLSPATQGRMG